MQWQSTLTMAIVFDMMNLNRRNIMDIVLLFTIVGAAAAVIASVYQFLRNFKTDINGHIDRLDREIGSLAVKVENDMRAQTARTDQLYQMFIDLLKEHKTRTDP
jgi:cell division protein FtsL